MEGNKINLDKYDEPEETEQSLSPCFQDTLVLQSPEFSAESILLFPENKT